MEQMCVVCVGTAVTTLMWCTRPPRVYITKCLQCSYVQLPLHRSLKQRRLLSAALMAARRRQQHQKPLLHRRPSVRSSSLDITCLRLVQQQHLLEQSIPRIWAANTAGTRRRAWLSGFIDRDDRCASHASADAAPGSQPSGSGKAASSSQKLADEVLTKMQPHVRDHTLANNRWVPMHCAHMCNHCYTHRRAAPLMIRRLVVNQQRMTAPVLLPQPSRRSWNFRPPMQLTQARNLPCLCLQAH